MPSFSQSSLDKLSGVHPDLQTLFHRVIEERDCTVVYGVRSQEEQIALYAKGRTAPGEIVTYKDGIIKKSRHQYGLAVDVVPYFSEAPHIRWNDKQAFISFGNYVLGVADELRRSGVIDSDVQWGGDWHSFKDYPHYQV